LGGAPRREVTARAHPYQGSAPGLFIQDHPSDLRERCTVADRYEPLGSGGMWTKCGPSRTRRTVSSPMLTASVLPHGRVGRRLGAARVDRVVGEALQMAGGHLTGTLKLLGVVSDRRRPAGTDPAAQLASGYTIPGGA
jgi:hypothetical protein